MKIRRFGEQSRILPIRAGAGLKKINSALSFKGISGGLNTAFLSLEIPRVNTMAKRNI
jgi:hypothetical protein